MTSDDRWAAASDERGAGMMPWRAFLARATVASGLLGIAMFVALRLAAASPGGPTRHELTYAGVLRNADGGVPGAARMTALTFTFSKTGAAPCVVEVPRVEVAAGGAFTAPVSLASCPNYFDGSDVTYTVAEGGTVLTDGGVPITPVPYARFADQVGVNNACPAGYDYDSSAVGITLCRKCRGPGRFENCYDDVVRVGTGASSFWIDRYEAGVWSNSTATDVQFGAGQPGPDDYPASFPDNGQWTTALYALSYTAGGISAPSIFPSRSLTWFQAQAACRASGKRLPTGEEWIAAAHGTVDPGSNAGNPGPCRTSAGAPRQTGLARHPSVTETCISRWGAEDMIGNVSEWTLDWYAGIGRAAFGTVPGMIVGPGMTPETNAGGSAAFPADRRSSAGWPNAGNLYSDDSTSNISSAVYPGGTGADYRFGLPSALIRGGAWNSSASAGIFHMSLDYSPTFSATSIGFRCVIPR